MCRGFWREEGGGGWAWVTESSGVGLVILMIDSGEQMYLNLAGVKAVRVGAFNKEEAANGLKLVLLHEGKLDIKDLK